MKRRWDPDLVTNSLVVKATVVAGRHVPTEPTNCGRGFHVWRWQDTVKSNLPPKGRRCECGGRTW